MDKNDFQAAVEALQAYKGKRKFSQTYELIVALKDINIKDADQKVDFFGTLNQARKKRVRVCALVGPELKDSAEKSCDMTIAVSDFIQYTDKKKIKKLATSYDYFIAQATIMAKVASTFGKVFGPKGKMPNPKAGCVVPPNANLEPLVERLQRTIRVITKNSPLLQIGVGDESMGLDAVTENLKSVYDQIVNHVPNGENNIKKVYVKLTMSPVVGVGRGAAKVKGGPEPVAQES